MKLPMPIANLGQHDLILGKSWLAEEDIWLDVRNRRLLWPEDRSPIEDIQEDVTARQEVIGLNYPIATI